MRRAAADGYITRIPRDFARRHLAVVTEADEDGVVQILVGPGIDPLVPLNVSRVLGFRYRCEERPETELAALIDSIYGPDPAETLAPPSNGNTADRGADGSTDDLDVLIERASRDLLSTEGKGPVVRLVDALLFEALRQGASDVHIQPLEDRVLVRYRTDGVLHTARELPRPALAGMVSRIKVMGRMDIAERRIPQDGRAAVTIGSGEHARSIDLRISTLPTSYGERAVIRLLDNRKHLSDFTELGMPEDVRERYLRLARRSNGMILLTGPTGSGKTTTLYATLREIGSADVNIMTVEDPIEYELSTTGLAISQSQVNARKGVTFATGLRHILRQDPDVVMVGEIRDEETARIAVQASLTGHLVFSTPHTNDSAGAITRLADLGLERYLVGASLLGVMAQRLVRLVHAPCGGRGCDGCFGTGYAGRRGIYELLELDQDLRDLIAAGGGASDLRRAAKERAFRTLADEGRALVADGRTSQVEVERVVEVAG